MNPSKRPWMPLAVTLAATFAVPDWVSAEFMHQPLIERLVWLRVPRDVIFSVGVLALAWFVLRPWVGPTHRSGSRRARPAAVLK